MQLLAAELYAEIDQIDVIASVSDQLAEEARGYLDELQGRKITEIEALYQKMKRAQLGAKCQEELLQQKIAVIKGYPEKLENIEGRESLLDSIELIKSKIYEKITLLGNLLKRIDEVMPKPPKNSLPPIDLSPIMKPKEFSWSEEWSFDE